MVQKLTVPRLDPAIPPAALAEAVTSAPLSQLVISLRLSWLPAMPPT